MVQPAFEASIDSAKGYFSQYPYSEYPLDQLRGNGLASAWKGPLHCAGKSIDIIVALTKAFPDELPKIYLPQKYEWLPVPHVDHNLYVCTFEGDEINFRSEDPEGLIVSSIEKARSILADGIKKTNLKDFEDEFLAYWAEGASGRIYSILHPDETIREVFLAAIESAPSTIKSIIGESEAQLKSYAINFSPKAKAKYLKKCLYIPLRRIPHPPYPKTAGEIFRFLRENDLKGDQAVFDFLHQNDYIGRIVFSVKINTDRVLGSWNHNQPPKKKINKGFRPHKLPPHMAKARLYLTKISRSTVKRVDIQRLQNRIEGRMPLKQAKPVCLIGCGAIGSEIAMQLAKSGVHNLLLIDPDELRPENVMRHVCGMSDIGKPKVKALSERINMHLPQIQIQPEEKTFHDVLHESPERFMDMGLIISATGNTALERRLNQIQLEFDAFPSILYTWIEPYGLASHALMIVKNSGGCYECCLDTDSLTYRFSVGNFGEKRGTIREAGCQTSVTPYSALEANQAANLACRLALGFLHDKIVASTRMVFLGDLGMGDQFSFSLNQGIDGNDAFSIKRAPVFQRKDCSHCGAT